MEDSAIHGAERLVSYLRQNPSELHDSRLDFLRSFLVSLGAEMPPADLKPVVVHTVDGLPSWNALLSKASSIPVVVDAFATWCGPCKAISPTYDRLAEEYQGRVIFSRFDVDQAMDLARNMNISAMPTFRMFKNGTEIDSCVGADPKKLENMIKKAAESSVDANQKESTNQCEEDTKQGSTQPDLGKEVDIDEDDEKAILEEKSLIDEFNRDAGVLPIEERDVNPKALPLGDVHAELSEADTSSMIELKQVAAQLAASEDWDTALEKYNELMRLKPSTLALAKRAEVLLHLKRPLAAIRDCETALKENESSAKALKIRGQAYALIGEWELAAKDLQKGNALDFDEEAGRAETEVEMRWNQIRELRLKRDAKRRDRAALKERKERERRRREAVERYEEEKASETAEKEFKPSQEQMPRGMPGGTPGGTPEGTPGLDGLLSGLNLSKDVREKLGKPEVREKLMTIFKELQGSSPDKAMSNVLKYISDPDVGPVVQAVISGMMGDAPRAGTGANSGADSKPATAKADVPPSGNDSSAADKGLNNMDGFTSSLADEVD
ncbi:unnamed protein product [Agarophyton chilense]